MKPNQALNEKAMPHTSPWSRGFFMLLLVMAFHISATLLLVVALAQFIFNLLNDQPNIRLRAFGLSLGRYLQQLAEYLCFASEDKPFPFRDWPSGN